MNKTNLKNGCVLCNGLSTDFSSMNKTYSDLTDSPVLFKTDNYVVIPDKYPLREGHILIVPKKHINSFAEFDNKESSEIGFIYDKLQQITNANSFLIFEHGTSKLEQVITDPKIKSIFHAHLQFIPNLRCTYEDLEAFFGMKDVQLLEVLNTPKSLKEYGQDYVGNGEIVNFLRQNITYDKESINSIASYLYIKTSDNDQFFFPEYLITPKLPSQFLREALSEVSDTQEWDWKLSITDEGLDKYFKRIVKTIDLFKK
jgi:diadenosine tetraphosphate (Ap4A) HIT family hydrolase